MNFDNVIKQGVEQVFKECELSIGMTLSEAVEKQISKKMSSTDDKCPTCNYEFPNINEDTYYVMILQGNYCPECGQKLDWSDSSVKSDISLPKFAEGGIVNIDSLFTLGDNPSDVVGDYFKQTVDAGFDLSYRNDMVDAMIHGLKVKVIEKQDVSFETIVPTLSMAASVVMEELRKHEDWYNTWVQMLAKCIEDTDGSLTSSELATIFIEGYLLGSD